MKTMFALGRQLRSETSNRTRRSASIERQQPPAVSTSQQAPHPIRPGQEGATCPITGLSADGTEPKQEILTAEAALAELQADPDIAEERQMLELSSSRPQKSLQVKAVAPSPQRPFAPLQRIPVNVVNGTHKSNSATKQLVRSIGGLPALRNFTEIFYQRCFADPHIDKFLRRHDDPHGERFATWIAEKFGDGTPWTNERRNRPSDTMQFGRGHAEEVAFDRSSAHFAAWHSPKREAHKWGQHFQPDDARVWMRLHFWAMRESGLFEQQYAAFTDYYMRFIGHFISIYSSKSPPFVRDSARWSADPANIERYLASGNCMADVIDVPLDRALASLPAEERLYTGSKVGNPAWPYN